MNGRSTYAFYGSLRKGMRNYLIYEKHLKFHSTQVVSGFLLFEMDDYPYAIQTGNPDHLLTVEIFTITDPETEKAIHKLELEVGYVCRELKVGGQSVGIYLFEKAGNERLVESGDWVEFFGKRF